MINKSTKNALKFFSIVVLWGCIHGQAGAVVITLQDNISGPTYMDQASGNNLVNGVFDLRGDTMTSATLYFNFEDDSLGDAAYSTWAANYYCVSRFLNLCTRLDRSVYHSTLDPHETALITVNGVQHYATNGRTISEYSFTHLYSVLDRNRLFEPEYWSQHYKSVSLYYNPFSFELVLDQALLDRFNSLGYVDYDIGIHTGDYNFVNAELRYEPAAIPAPGTVALLCMGIFAFSGWRLQNSYPPAKPGDSDSSLGIA